MTDSSNEEEARTAAMTAIKLIKKHKIEFRLPGHESVINENLGESLEDFQEKLRQAFNIHMGHSPGKHTGSRSAKNPPPTYPWPEHATKRATESATYRGPDPAQKPPAPKPPQKPKPAESAAPAKPKHQPVLMESRFGGNCLMCKRRYLKGDMIYWAKGKGVTHEFCESYWKDVDC